MADKVTRLQVAQYIDRHVGEFKCEVCGNNRFHLIGDPSSENIGLVAEAEGGPLQSINTCAIYCNNCGNVKLLLQQHIANWLKENADE